jgi:hypothetical protein
MWKLLEFVIPLHQVAYRLDRGLADEPVVVHEKLDDRENDLRFALLHKERNVFKQTLLHVPAHTEDAG